MSLRAPLRQTRPENRPRHLHAVETIALPAAAPGTDSALPPPPPEVAVQKLALYTFEAVEGFRPIAGLGRLISPGVIDELTVQRRARTEQRSLHGDTRRVVPLPGPAHLSRPQPHVVEAVVVLRAVPRSTAVALRFECLQGRWQATQITVL